MPKKIPSQKVEKYKEKLELVKWLTTRGDNLRESTASRASIVVSADALLLAGFTFLVDKILNTLSSQSIWIQTIMLSLLVGIILFIFLSLFYAASGIATIWNMSPKRIDSDAPDVPVFNAFQTVEKFSNFSEFRTFCENVDNKQLFISDVDKAFDAYKERWPDDSDS